MPKAKTAQPSRVIPTLAILLETLEYFLPPQSKMPSPPHPPDKYLSFKNLLSKSLAVASL